MSATMWPGSCSTEEDLGVKMEHNAGTSWCHFAKGKSPLRLSGWLCTSFQVEQCPALGPILLKRCGAIRENLEDSSGNKN